LVTSNTHDAIQIPDNDRRFTVAKRQMDKFAMTPSEFNQIQDELQLFTDYLVSRKACAETARQVIDTEARQDMKDLTQTSSALTSRAILTGDCTFFIDHAPRPDALNMKTFNSSMLNVSEVYMELMRRIAHDGREVPLDRRDLYALFEHTVGNIPTTSNKFTAFLRHQDIVTKSIKTHDGGRDMGIKVNFRIDQEFLDWVKSRTIPTAVNVTPIKKQVKK
jgi:hypothetical protein